MTRTNFFKKQLEQNDLVAAPMAGISIPPFRKLLRMFHDGLIYSEMVSVEGVKRNNQASMYYLDSMDEGPFVVQIFGGNVESYPPAAREAEEYARIDAFDINMGCPVKKVIKTGGGCALITDIDKIYRIVNALRSSTKKPISVKTRVGWDDSKYVHKEITDAATRAGADAITFHARTKSQMFGGVIKYDLLAEVASISEIPVIGNGDVYCYESYTKMKETGVAGVMIGRGMIHAPWIFRSIKEKANTQTFLTPSEMHDLLLKFYGYMQDYAVGKHKLMFHFNNIIKKFAVWFSKGLKDSAAFRSDIYKDDDMERFFILLKYFNNSVFEQTL